MLVSVVCYYMCMIDDDDAPPSAWGFVCGSEGYAPSHTGYTKYSLG